MEQHISTVIPAILAAAKPKGMTSIGKVSMTSTSVDDWFRYSDDPELALILAAVQDKKMDIITAATRIRRKSSAWHVAVSSDRQRNEGEDVDPQTTPTEAVSHE